MKLSLLLLVIVACVCATYAATCRCYKRERYTTRCGRWGWSRCTRYRNRAYNCPCPVHGGWSAYLARNVGSCSASCGGGKMKQQLTRTCTNPRPANGGRNCAGSATASRYVPCNAQPCPVNGGWSDYSDWKEVGECTKKCGKGYQKWTRSRTCNNPAPQYGGRNCVGSESSLKYSLCNTHPCPVHGGWSGWSAWKKAGSCSVTCGMGRQLWMRTRSCTKPSPKYGGKKCSGISSFKFYLLCSMKPCPVHGEWNDWQEWSAIKECPVLCGGSKTDFHRHRTCTEPKYGGRPCEGDAREVREEHECNTEECGERCPADRPTALGHAENTKFYQCEDSVAHLRTCPAYSTFNENAERCTAIPCNSMDGLVQGTGTDSTHFLLCLAGQQVIEVSCPPGTSFNSDEKQCL